jgi:hypothetical protein
MTSLKIDADFQNNLEKSIIRLLDYCKKNDWAGYDPYDALNSRIFKALPFLDFRLFRLGLTQMLKRSPVNFRPFLLVPKTENPKALALFLMAFLKLRKLGLLESDDLIQLMIQKLIKLRSPLNPTNSNTLNPTNPTNPTNPSNPTNPTNATNPYWFWGYSFPWQTRTILVPRAAPNLVCTVFIAGALLDIYEDTQEERYLSMATSAAEYILNELYWTEGDSIASLSYPLPSLQTRVHNANLLGAALFCRVYKLAGEKKFIEPALKLARYSAGKQREDGSWDYGEHSTQRWVDNFHTGYNLCALQSICQYAGTSEFEPHIRRGFEFYRKNFFRDDGAPKYFHNRTYPLDIHSVAQSIITLLAFKDLDENNVNLAHAVFRWAKANMFNYHGYYYYQKTPYYTIQIPYMRWSQAWMLLALSTLLEQKESSPQSRKERRGG